jgi:hypothetical protein
VKHLRTATQDGHMITTIDTQLLGIFLAIAFFAGLVI